MYRNHINTTDLSELKGFNRIIYASSEQFPDTQVLLYYTNILITDYSGIYFDFLLLKRPIIFYDYDFEEYNRVRGFLFDYYEHTPGPKVKTQEELLKAIERYLENPSLDKEKRELLKNKFHKYTDGKASERVYNKIKELL